MPDYPPFMNSYNLVPKILQKMKEAKTPERFTQDYLANTLGFPGGSARPFVSFAKRLGLLSTDGVPTELYHQFRNPDHSKGAMARAMKVGYADLFTRNENAHKLDRKGLEGLIVQATGLDSGSTTLRSIVGTFENLKPLADFGQAGTSSEKPILPEMPLLPIGGDEEEDIKLNLSYTINLVLPKTDDVAVFNAIFRALRENLLRR
ncbi:MAG: DUF5343 domain-containing protein [Anaerolineales bacterium]